MSASGKTCLRFVVMMATATLAFLLIGCAGKEEKPRPLTAQEVRGQRLYQSTCAACHRADSTDPVNGPGLKGVMKRPFLPSGAPANDERVRELLKIGRKTMPSYHGILDDRQMDDIIAYIKTL